MFEEIKPFGALNLCLTSARFLWCGERLRELGERRGKGGRLAEKEGSGRYVWGR